jgi:hypothetical protein
VYIYRLAFIPNYCIYYRRITLYYPDDFGSDIAIPVIHRAPVLAIEQIHRHRGRLQQRFRRIAPYHDRALVEHFRTLGRIAQQNGGESEDGRFLAQGSRIRNDALGIALQSAIVGKTQRLYAMNEWIQGYVVGFETLPRSGMCRKHDGEFISFRKAVQGCNKLVELILDIDVFFPMHAQDEVPALLDAILFKRLGGFDFGPVLEDYFGHWRASDKDMFLTEPLGQQIPPGMFRVRKIDVGDVVDDFPVYFLGHVLIETAVARFHVEDGNFEALRGDRAQGGIRIAEDEERIGFFFHKQFVRSRNDVPHGLAEVVADNVEVAVGSPQTEVLEEYLVERVVPVLARMDKDMLEAPVAGPNHFGKSDDLRPCSDYGHHFKLIFHSNL